MIEINGKRGSGKSMLVAQHDDDDDDDIYYEDCNYFKMVKVWLIFFSVREGKLYFYTVWKAYSYVDEQKERHI